MKTKQDKVEREFDEKLTWYIGWINADCPKELKESRKDLSELFSSKLKEAYNAGREDSIKDIRKMETSSYTLDGAYRNENIDFICKKLKKLQINQKES